METAEIRELISAFVPEEILRDFELREVKKKCGGLPALYGREGRLGPLSPGAVGDKRGGPMRVYESLRDPVLPHSRPGGFHLHMPSEVEGEGRLRVLLQHL